MSRQISEGRKVTYYAGLVIAAIGILLFGSVFVTAALHFGDFSNFEADAKSEMFRAIGGMALATVGGIMAAIGMRGAAGSGVVLDPEKAREDLEPFSRMAGGMVKDALDEADIRLGQGQQVAKVVIKCQACGALNDEDAKFCKECGKKL